MAQSKMYLQGVAIAAELPEELLQAVNSLRSFSDGAAKAAKMSDAPELAAKHRAFAGGDSQTSFTSSYSDSSMSHT